MAANLVPMQPGTMLNRILGFGQLKHRERRTRPLLKLARRSGVRIFPHSLQLHDLVARGS